MFGFEPQTSNPEPQTILQRATIPALYTIKAGDVDCSEIFIKARKEADIPGT
jgi:hypothetical protein